MSVAVAFRELTVDESRFYRDQLRDARAAALADAEGFQKVLFAVEMLGMRLYDGKNILSFGAYQDSLRALALTACDTADHAGFRARFDSLYELVKDARNDAMHQGAYARHITANATTLAIMLEDTLMIKSKTVADFMVRNVTCAAPWHSIAHIRQLMLASSFSTLPVSGVGDHRWRLVRDHAVAAFIRAADSKSQRTQKLKITLKEAARLDSALELTEAKTCSEHMTVDDALRLLQDNLLLVVLRNEDAPQDSKVTCPEDIMGIITAFDLL